MGSIGKLNTSKPIENAIKEIREWLERIGISGLSIDIKYDARQNISLVKFQYKNQSYEFRSIKQKNCRLNMWAIARVMESKVRSHLMDIENFEKSMTAYLQLGTGENYQASNFEVKLNEVNYIKLGISSLVSNEELKQKHKELMKAWHPDMALSSEAKKEFEKKVSEINEAWNEIKKERGI